MILFLDFDGVLHPISSRIVRREAGTLVIEQYPQGEPLFCRVPLLAAVLRDFPEVRIVLSTSWTRYVSMPALLEPLDNLADRVVGIIPQERGLSRHERVKAYLEEAGESRWLALEDDRRNYPQTAPVVWTDSATGLTIKDLAILRQRLAVAEVLDDFADLKISRHEAMNRLGIEWYGDLLQLINASGRKIKTIPESDAKELAADFVQVVTNHEKGDRE